MTGHTYKITLRVGYNADITDHETEKIVAKQVWEVLDKVFPTEIVLVEKESSNDR